jgi:hypothetical protein
LPNDRFSKAKLAAYVERRRIELQTEFGFDPTNGWAQVEGKGEAVNRAYGEYDSLANLVDVFGL